MWQTKLSFVLAKRVPTTKNVEWRHRQLAHSASWHWVSTIICIPELPLTMVSLQSCQTKINDDIFASELIIAVGSYFGNKKTELLDVAENNWSSADDYPFDWGLTKFFISLSFSVYPQYKSANIFTAPRSLTPETLSTSLVESLMLLLSAIPRRQSVDST